PTFPFITTPLSALSLLTTDTPSAHYDSPSFPTRRSSDLTTSSTTTQPTTTTTRPTNTTSTTTTSITTTTGPATTTTTTSSTTTQDRKSTRLNSSHVASSYADFPPKKKIADRRPGPRRSRE